MRGTSMMQISFWGVRGSIPAPGPEFNRYGGNTSCVTLRGGDGALLILDAGMGATVLGRELMKSEFATGGGGAVLLLTHTHWDHIQGYPFFVPFFIPGNHFVVYGAGGSPDVLEGILDGQLNPHYSPLHSLDNLPATMDFRAVEEGMAEQIQGLLVSACKVPHGRSHALAYRIEEGDQAVVYAPDVIHDPDALDPGVQQLFQGATYLIHDTTYTPEDQRGRRSRGQSSIAEVARVAASCKVQNLVMFHYDQDYSDDQVDRLAESCRKYLDDQPGGKEIGLVASREGMTLEVG